MLRSKKAAHLALVAALSAIPAAQPAEAGVGVQLGARGGLEFDKSDDLFVGAEARLSFPLSPLTINPTYDHYFIEGEALTQIAVNALYDLPIAAPLIGPYVGLGVCVNLFSIDDPAPDVDEHGTRLGLNLVGGVRFDLPVVRPFIQGVVSIGEVDVVTLGGGVLFDIGGG